MTAGNDLRNQAGQHVSMILQTCAARLGKDGYINQIAGYSTNGEDVNPRFVSWAIFEILWGKTRNRDTNEIEDLTRSRMAMTRVCIYHVNQSHISRAAAMCGEVIATMCWECVRYEVDIVAGDGNKAAYYATPKAPGIPTYECSLLQFWIDRMINTATQARIKQYGPSPKVRAKHFITCSYNDLVHLSHNLRNITTEKYTEELAKKTEGYGDCCMLSVLEWGHSSNYLSEDFGDYDDEDHMDYEGEFSFQVNETCLHGNSKSFLIHKMTEILTIHCLFTLLHRKWLGMKQEHIFIGRNVIKRNQDRKAKQNANKRKSSQEEHAGQGYWSGIFGSILVVEAKISMSADF